MIEYLTLLIVIVFFIIASYEDFKKREVYDYLNYLFLILVLAIPIFELIIKNNLDPLKLALFGAFIGFAIGTLLFYLGIWGGGDIKFLIGFSAAANYLTGFTNSFKYYSTKIVGFDIIPNSKEFILQYIIYFIVLIDLVAVLYLLYLLYDKRIERVNDFYVILASLVLFTLTLLIYINFFSVVVLSFIAFLCFFFADEDLFSSFYFRRKVNVHSLKERDYVDEDITENNEIVIPYGKTKEGLSKSQIEKIKLIKTNQTVIKRQILPYFFLFGLNIFFVAIKLIDFTSKAFEILSFVLSFLFISFVAGGVGAVLILFYTYIRYHKEIKVGFSIYEKLGALIFSLIGLMVFIVYNFSFSMPFFLIGFSFLFFKLTKEGEKYLFISDKDLSKIVPGDWVVQDVLVKNQVLYSKEDFKLGIEEKQIEKIKSLSKANTGLKKLKVKDGIPFIPALFLGFIIILII